MSTIAFITAVTNDNTDSNDADMVADANALSAIIADAAPGVVVIYHVGMLARDRYPNLSHLPEDRRAELNVLADYALRLADAGWVHLLQRRIAEERFAYLLVIRHRLRSARRGEMPTLRPLMMAEAA